MDAHALHLPGSGIMISSMCTVVVERRKLYEQVWTLPGSQLSALYGISDVGLAKVCRRYNIPRPPRGYWVRLAAGKHVHKPKLPRGDGDNEVIYLKGWNMPDETLQQFVDDRASAVENTASASNQSATSVSSYNEGADLICDPECGGSHYCSNTGTSRPDITVDH